MNIGGIISELYSYPLKGLNGQQIEVVEIEKNNMFPLDRIYAIENNNSKFNELNPIHFKKTAFLVLMRYEKLALLQTAYDHETNILTIRINNVIVAKGNLQESKGRKIIELFFLKYMHFSSDQALRLVSAKNHNFSDIKEKYISVINIETIKSLSKIAGFYIDPIRFRANIYLKDVEPWEEVNWLNKVILSGSAELIGIREITRCAATNVNPKTAIRDINIPNLLLKNFGHMNCGIYLQVTKGGLLKKHDDLVIK